jgi:hypothetical protein
MMTMIIISAIITMTMATMVNRMTNVNVNANTSAMM